MNVALVQFDIAWEDKTANHRTMEAMLDAATVPSGSFVVLPELGDTGFSFNLSTIVDDRSMAWARETARSRGIWLQVGYARHGADGKGLNCATILDPDGEPLGTFEKLHPFSYGREVEHFSGGDHLLITDVAGMRVCPMICYDLRFPEAWRVGARAGAEVFTIGASWPDARQHHWRALLIARAIENQAFVIAVNRTGRDPHLGYAGGSMIISPMGEIIAEADNNACVLQGDVDAGAVRTWRATFPALDDIRPDVLGDIPVQSTTPGN